MQPGRDDKMLIGVDVTCFGGIEAGVARYLREALSQMMVLAPGVGFLLYSPIPVDVQLPPGNWRLRVASGQRLAVPGRWLRETLPHMIADDRVDAYWGQNQMMPDRWLRPCRRVVTIHDMGGDVCPESLHLRNRLSWRRNMRATVRVADGIVADSHATARLLCGFLGVPTSRVAVIYPGRSQCLRTLGSAVARQQVMARFGLPDDFILTVGTLEPRKGHATLLNAVKLRKGMPLLVVVGATGWKSRGITGQVREAERLGIARHIGRVSDDDLEALYGAAKLTICPSFYEGFGLPVLEAMACGCPVLCSWSSSMPEVGGSAAAYFRPLDTDDLAIQLASLLGDGRRLAEMRILGLEQSARFSSDDVARHLLGILLDGSWHRIAV